MAVLAVAAALLAAPGRGAARQESATGRIYYEDFDFTALAVDADHGLIFGMGWGDTPGIAEDYALGECRSNGGTHCRLLFDGGAEGCVAYADDGRAAWGGGSGSSEDVAIDDALHACAERTCIVRMAVCPS